MSYFRPHIDRLSGYIYSEQPPIGTQVIKLNTNENPYPPSPKAMEVLRNIDSEYLRRYPDPDAKEFCQAVSEVLEVPEDWIIVGNGSDEMLNVLVRSCAEESTRPIVYPTPTYVLYRTLAAVQPASAVEIPYPDDFKLPLEELIAAKGAVTFIATPNSPSGHAVPLEDLRELAKGVAGVVAIDEAYVDFAELSAIELVKELENVIILRTLSKGYSLAGLRLGFAIANPKLLAGLSKVKDAYNMDAIALAVGTAAIGDIDYKNACAEKVKSSRAKLTTDLRKLGFKVPESQGNFVLATPSAINAESLHLALREKGILVRYFKQPGLEDKLRISVGTEEQNRILIETLAALIGDRQVAL